MADKELFIPTRDTVATPPPAHKRIKPKLTADQNIYLAKKQVAGFSFNLVSLVLILGLCFVILYPFLQLVPTVFSALEDLGNPNVIWIPEEWSTLSFTAAARMTMSEGIMTMVKSIFFALILMVIQVFVSAMTGYTMARVKYKWLNLLMYVLVILVFLTPRQSLLLAQYIYFSNFDGLGLIPLLQDIFPNAAWLR